MKSDLWRARVGPPRRAYADQVNLPLPETVVPSKFGQRYAYGLVEEGGRRLFVTGGIGTSIIPVRFRVPPEVVVLTLNRE
jgi:predicted MPP superfamily phosphohydrolase